MVSIERVLQRYRSSFVGKSSPAQFFWGSFDLSQTRFNGRPASVPAGAPRFMRLAEDQENIACGFWPGNINMGGVTFGEPAFYSYIYPEPEWLSAVAGPPRCRPFQRTAGGVHPAVRCGAACFGSGEQTLLEFFQSTYEAAARFALWDRASLERPSRKGALEPWLMRIWIRFRWLPRAATAARNVSRSGDEWVHLRDLHGLRPRRLLRQLQEQARHQALSPNRAPHHEIVRAGRGMGLVLHRRGDARRLPLADQRSTRPSAEHRLATTSLLIHGNRLSGPVHCVTARA